MKNLILMLSFFSLFGCKSTKTELQFNEQPTTLQVNSINGEKIYQQNCASCHGTLLNSTKKDRSSSEIANAISDITSMSYLKFLSDSELDAIALALGDKQAPVISNALPQGILPGASTSKVTLSIQSDINVACRFDSAIDNYQDMQNSFNANSDGLLHSFNLNVERSRQYSFFTQCYDSQSDLYSNVLKIVFSVDSSTVDTEPPVLSNLLPNSTLDSGTTNTILGLQTNENATCKYSANSNASFDQMTPFSITGSLTHSHSISGLQDGMNYRFYVACSDSVQNISNVSTLNFDIANFSAPSNGEILYANNCASCHNDLANSSKLNRTGQDIQNAISQIGAMQYLSFLSSSEVDSISKVLSGISVPKATNPLPSGILPYSTTTVSLSIQTDIESLCKYDTQDIDFNSMTSSLNASSDFLSHSQQIAVERGLSYRFYVRCRNNFGDTMSNSSIIEFSIDNTTVDSIPPTLSNPLPAGELISGTSNVQLSISSNENSICHYSMNSSDSFAQMAAMTQTGALQHIQAISGLIDGASYSYYIKCQDTAQNESALATVNFSVQAYMAPDGTTLYNNNCMSCHGSLSSSKVSGKTSIEIQKAISDIRPMNKSFLKALTVEEIDAIANALK